MEWIPFDGPRPQVGDGAVVWIVIPPSNRSGISNHLNEKLSLLETATNLITMQEPVMLNMQPSLLPRYGQVGSMGDIGEIYRSHS